MKNKDFINFIFEIGEKTFNKLKDVKIPPYPKYYHETFMDLVRKTDNDSIRSFIKKYDFLFNSDDKENALLAGCYEVAKDSIKEFENSNNNIKKISKENSIDIGEVKNEPDRLEAPKILNTFLKFQDSIFEELRRADDTIMKLKLEIEKLEKESSIDPLTKVHNRRAFLKDLEEILSFGKERDLDLFLLMIDSDNFKNINDTFGHIAGDKTLIYLSKLIHSLLRRGTRIYRYGGDEFIVVLNRIDKVDALKTAERILKDMAESKLYYKGNNIKLTISIGITQHKAGDSADEIVHRADEALYKAKTNGKNRYEVL